jgi:hypothetical protein
MEDGSVNGRKVNGKQCVMKNWRFGACNSNVKTLQSKRRIY